MIRSAVDSVLAQSYRPIEIIIVDDGSTDDTQQVCNALSDENRGLIRVLCQENIGPGPAREKGRLAARGGYIQYLDSDDRLLPGKFADQVASLEKHMDCGIAYGISRLIDFDGQVLAEPFKWTGEVRDYLFPGLLVDRWWCTHTPLYRRTVCDEIGPWADLRYSQDWEYDARAGALGTKLVTSNTLVSEHRTHGEARQTGHGKWLDPADQVRFFSKIYDCARLAGEGGSTLEMRHFSRWVFAQARKSGEAGHTAAAKKLYTLAVAAIGSPDLKMRMTGVIAATLGWKITGKVSRFRDSLIGSAGQDTMKQSWMQDHE